MSSNASEIFVRVFKPIFFHFCKLPFFSSLQSFFPKTRNIPHYWEQELQKQRQICGRELAGEIHWDAFAAFKQPQLVG